LSTPKIKLDETLIREITNGVDRTFSNLFGISPKAEPYEMLRDCSHLTGDISGIVTAIQEDFSGSLVVSFPKATIYNLLEKIYGRSFDSVNDSVRGGVGELTNIIYGVIKANLHERGLELRMCIPHIIVGDGHSVMSPMVEKVLVVPFKSPAGDFLVLGMLDKIESVGSYKLKNVI
jgi:chemotaxis protein CheX